MNREISVHNVGEEGLRTELRFLVTYFRNLGLTECRVLFGWHWGMDYYSTSPWQEETILLAKLEDIIGTVEAKEIGRLGGDDLHLFFPAQNCEFCFCHHGGIHLSFTTREAAVEDFLQRWTLAGLLPAERDLPCATEES